MYAKYLILCCILSNLTVTELNLQCTLLVIASRLTPCSYLSIVILSYFFSFQFYTHANSDHLDLISQDWLSCNICNIFLPTSAAIKNHKSSNHSAKPTSAAMENHKSSNHSAKSSTTDRVQCRYCHNSYLTAFQYYKHANKAHLVSDTVII